MFYCFANDNCQFFPPLSTPSIEDAIAYGEKQGVPFTVAAPSGAVAATKAYPDSETIRFYGISEAL